MRDNVDVSYLGSGVGGGGGGGKFVVIVLDSGVMGKGGVCGYILMGVGG